MSEIPDINDDGLTPQAPVPEPLPPGKFMCGRCYDVVDAVFPAPCEEKPELLAGAPIGMYHCPDCGAMLLAGEPHWPVCELCRDRKHPSFDIPPEGPPE